MRKGLFFLVFFILVFGFFSTIQAKTLVVDNSYLSYLLGYYCENGDEYYHSIKRALENADNGDVIKICAGSYNESNLEINKNITIEGLGTSPDDVKVEYWSKSPIFYTSGWRNGVVLENFSISQERNNRTALSIGEGTGFLLKNLKIVSKGYGLVVNSQIQNSTLTNVYINSSQIALDVENSYNGLYLSNSTFISKRNDAVNINNITGDFSVKGCEFEAKRGDGIWIKNSNYIDIEDSYIHNTKYEGFYVEKNHEKIDMVGNLIENPGNYGVYINDSSNPGKIKNNIIKGASVEGLYLLSQKKWRGYQVINNCFENGNGKNVFNRDRNADFNENYYNDWSGSGAYEIPDVPVYDYHPLSSCPFSSIPKPIIDYHMDECKWDNDSSTYEIKNYGSLESDYNATALNGANTIANGEICRGGDIVSSNTEDKALRLKSDYLLPTKYTLNVWIKFPLNTEDHKIFTYGFFWNRTNVKYFNIADRKGGNRDFIYFTQNLNNNSWTLDVDDDNEGDSYNFNPQKFSGWHMLTFVINNRGTKFYLDGKEEYTFSTHPNTGYLGLLFNSDYGGNTDEPNGQSIGTDVDEFELYNTALTANQIRQIYNNENAGKNYNGTTRTCPVCMAIDHYEIWHYPTNLTCQPAPLEIKACANDNCSRLYTDNVTLTLDYDSESKEISFSGGEYNTTISYTQAGTITLSTSNESPTPSSPTICNIFNSSSTSCDITFKDTGFVFKTPTNSDYVVNNILSCSVKPIEIDAVQKDNVTNKCTNMSVFNGDVTLNMYGRYVTPSANPYGTKVMINDASVETVDYNSTATGTSLTLHFDNGTAQFNLSYPDAGSIEVGAIYDKNGLKVSGESNPFVVKPERFAFGNLSSPADNSTCSTDSCWANIGVFKKAGEIFNFDVKAVCDNGTVTPNYYPINQNGDNSTVNLAAFMVAPDNGTDVTNKLSKTTIDASEFNGGVAKVKESFGEIGVIDLKAVDNNYLGAGSIGVDKKVGRFIPHHFVIDNITNGTLKEQCNTFNYIGQTTTYDAKPFFYVIAENKDNQTTLNYKGYFFKLKASDIGITKPQHDDNKTQVSIEIERATPDFKKGNGVGTYTFGNDNITYVKDNNSKIAPFSPEFHFSIDNVTDSDNVTCPDCPDNITVTGTLMKYGRLKIFNNYGPGNEKLILKVQTQYWNGAQWELNGDDVCTVLDSSDFVLDNFTGNLSDNDTSVSSVNEIDAGEGGLTLSPPGLDKYGSIDVDLSNSAIFYNWLYDNDTKGTAFFGIYRGRDRVIEWKEVAP
ncbi:DUF6701 domain-containing protein [Hippea sp. KM1]|uniref:DUF6701 domain-containing protein n=1 Tax=Hippea sp. KM1 TaxID=944481 RepID=UPI00046CD23B|nr:DUF6701 domain-containing protein [Hippea sp. KM1]